MYHVRITPHSDPYHDETKIDLAEDELREQFLEPYESGRPIVVNGRVFPTDDLQRIRISYAEQPSDYVREVIRAEDRNSSVVFVGGPSMEWRIADKAQDVTDRFIKGPPGHSRTHDEPTRRANRQIFIAHSGETSALNRLLRFLRALGMEPQIAEWLPSSGQQVPDHVRRVFGDCECAVIFAEATRPEGNISRPGAGVLIEVGLLQSHFGQKIIYLREENSSFGAMADSFVEARFSQDNLEEAFYKIVLELRGWGYI